MSPSSIRLIGWAPEGIIGKGPAEFILTEDMPALQAAFDNHRAGSESSLHTVRMRRKDDTAVWVEASARLNRMRCSQDAFHSSYSTVSVGAATALSSVGASVQMPAGLLQAADTALYKAKNKGRDRVETALLLSGDDQVSHAA